MKRASILIACGIAAAMLLAAVAVSYSALDPSNDTAGLGSGDWQDTVVVPLSANSQLSLDGQVDRGAPSGVAILQVNDDNDEVGYQVWVANIAPPSEVTIDLGADTAVQLYPDDGEQIDSSGTFTGLLAKGTFDSSDLTGPLQGQNIPGFVEALKSGQLNVDVSDGAISGLIDESTIWENAQLVPLLPMQQLTPNAFSEFLDRFGLGSSLDNPSVTDEVLSNLVGRNLGSVLWDIPWGAAVISNENGALHYGIWAFNLAGVTQVTLNYRGMEQEGPSVASLYSGGSAPDIIRGKLTEGTLTDNDLVGPLRGQTISDVVSAIDSGDIFVTLEPAQNGVEALKAQPYSLV